MSGKIGTSGERNDESNGKVIHDYKSIQEMRLEWMVIGRKVGKHM